MFTGVAGAADPALNQWDVVLADAVVQHDMDARPLFPRFTLPALNQTDSSHIRLGSTGPRPLCMRPTTQASSRECTALQWSDCHGDRFIGNPAVLQTLRDALPDLRAVEMEGAAVAQVAEQEGVAWLVLRVISDGADETAAQSFEDFVKHYEQQSWRLIEALLQHCTDAPQVCA